MTMDKKYCKGSNAGAFSCEPLVGADEVKDFLARWCEECPEVLVEPLLWAGFRQKGFDNIRLRYEPPHQVWQFSMKMPRDARKSATEMKMLFLRALCDSGYTIAKDAAAVMIEGTRVRGAFRLVQD